MLQESLKKSDDLPPAVNGRILLLEDDPHLMRFYREHFRRFGFEIFVEDNEDDGLEMAISCLPDVIILDISLPKNDDFDFLINMKKHPQLIDIPVVILTDLNDDSDRQRGLLQGAKDYLVMGDLKLSDISERIQLVIEKEKNKNKK